MGNGGEEMEFRDLKSQYQRYKVEINKAIQSVMETGHFINGREVEELETQLSEYVGVKHCITCANGTEAMTLLMMAWDIKEGDAVFVPDFTFFSTGEIVAFRGATPVFVDVERATFNMDPLRLEQAIKHIIQEGILTPKVIIPVDLFGLPANYLEIMGIAEKYNLKVLEDAAQGFGGSVGGEKTCSFGDAATTSFFPAKPLGCYGDGGAIFTDDENLAKLINSLKVHGKGENKYDNVRIGVNSRLDTIQAAILLVKLKAFNQHELADVNRVADVYKQQLKGMVQIPVIPAGYISSYAQYTITLKTKEERNKLQLYLNERNIPSMVYYSKPMHKQEAFSNLKLTDHDFEVTNSLCETVLSLPMHPYLTDEEITMICQEIKQYFIDMQFRKEA